MSTTIITVVFYFYYEKKVGARLGKALNAMPKRWTEQTGDVGFSGDVLPVDPAHYAQSRAGKLDLCKQTHFAGTRGAGCLRNCTEYPSLKQRLPVK